MCSVFTMYDDGRGRENRTKINHETVLFINYIFIILFSTKVNPG